MSDGYPTRKDKAKAAAWVVGPATAVGGAAIVAKKIGKPSGQGLKAPTAKLSEKVMLRVIKNTPDVVWPKDQRRFTRVFDSHSKRHGLSKKVMQAGYKAANESNLSFNARTMGKAFVGGFAEGMNKIRKITAAGVVADILKPTPVGDATLDGKKYTSGWYGSAAARKYALKNK